MFSPLVHSLCILLSTDATAPFWLFAPMKKRSYDTSFLEKPKRKPQKKVCNLGSKCPYQEEYQHMLEFSHDVDPVERKGGASTNRDFHAFSGSGVKLGASAPGLPVGFANGKYSALQQSPASQPIRCEICSQQISIKTLEEHLQSHENSGDMLKRQQDNEYEESVLLELQRQDEAALAKRRALELEREAAEKKELDEALARSVSLSNKGLLFIVLNCTGNIL